jgi:hypothetical protein
MRPTILEDLISSNRQGFWDLNMAFSIKADLGDKKPHFQFADAVPGETHVAIVIDETRIDLQECDWPPDEACTFTRRSGPTEGADAVASFVSDTGWIAGQSEPASFADC